MAWRNLLVTKDATLSLKNKQVFCKTKDTTISVPLEDIASITLETRCSTITAPLLGALADSDAVLISCNERHMPNGVLLPLGSHSRTLLMLKRQIGWTPHFKKKLHQQIIQQKIINQQRLLFHLGVDNQRLSYLAKSVDSGDSKNCEAQAAKYYFSCLFSNFRRHDNDKTNAALNYGYAVIRAKVARELVHFGFHPALGLFHHSELNAFNLADDLLEPFRPLVDGWGHALLSESGGSELSIQDRATLTQVLQLACVIDGKQHRLEHAVHLCIKSLASIRVKIDCKNLHLPQWSGEAKLKEID